jgi:short-subunit dehydrogenase
VPNPTPPLHRDPAWKNPATVLITGASGGLGGALALEYARSGRTLLLHGRDPARLAAVAQACQQRGAQVVIKLFDLRETEAAGAALRALAEPQPIDLAIVNAGVGQTSGAEEETESFEAGRALLAVNLDGALLTVAAVLPAMRRRGTGQIALISSLAAYIGVPLTPTYCASKSALKVYGEALRAWLAPHGIAINVVMPGFVRTPMSTRIRGSKPGMVSAARAAQLIRRGLERNRARITFPRLLAAGMWWLPLMPSALAQWILRGLGLGK